MPTSKIATTPELFAQFYLAEQVDLLHLSITNLAEMVKQGEVDLILDQRDKNDSQKKAFLQKIVAGVESPLFKQYLEGRLTDNDIEFFRERNLNAALSTIQHEAEKIVVVKLTLALEFKEPELRQMAAQLSEQLEAPVVLDITIEKGLMGGAIVQYGTAIRDFSLRTRLEQVREHWKSAVVEA